MSNYHNQKTGFSLLEMLLVLSLIIIILMITVPSQNLFLTKSKMDVLSSQLLRAIALTRNEAISRGEKVTLCGSSNQKTCAVGFNNMGYLIFSAEKTLYSIQNIANDGMLHWQAFPNDRVDLQFLSSGFTNGENGTFYYCEKTAKIPSFAVAVSQSGRARLLSMNELKGNGYEC